MLERVDRDQELDQPFIHRGGRGLQDEHIVSPDVLLDLDHHVLVGELHNARAAYRYIKNTADLLRELGVRST